MHIFQRSEMLIGKENINFLNKSKVLVFGLGGVGGSLCESLVRAGIGSIDIVDRDVVDLTNLNRQIIATQDTIGLKKVDAMYDRLKSINPDVNINKYDLNLDASTITEFDLGSYDYIADAIDTVTSKILLAKLCYENGFKLISAMGAGNRLDPTKFEVTDVFKTKNCPLAKVMRSELKKRGVKKLKVVYSTELPMKPIFKLEKASSPASISFVPPVCGMVMASTIVKDLIDLKEKNEL